MPRAIPTDPLVADNEMSGEESINYCPTCRIPVAQEPLLIRPDPPRRRGTPTAAGLALH